MNDPWHIQLFGVLRARQEERLIARFRTQQTGALLAYLAYHRHSSHTREALIELFWPESEPETGRHNLSNALSSLRNQLEPPGVPSGAVIIADRFSVELNPEAVTTDVAEFERALRRAAQARTAPDYAQRLAEAAEKYRGSLLPHYYEDWIAPEQERLQQRFLQTVSQLIGLLEKAGELERALEFAQRSLAADPLREESHREVMRLLAAAGQPEAALRQFRELESLFSQELGESPSSAAQQLARQIEAQVTSAPAASIPTPVPLPPPARSDASMPPLPTGTVTFLLTDIEGSTALWEKTGEAFRSALTTHHALVRSEFRRSGGREVKEAGDSFLVAFAGAGDALFCAIGCQRALEVQPWPESIGSLKVRMALHTGDVELEDGEYHGLMLHRAARMLSAGHGGQILVSEATAGLLRRDLEPATHLKDLGVWRLRDVEEPERLFQVESSKLERQEFPPLNAAPAQTARLPLQFTRFFGRTKEIANIAERLQSPEMHLLTLTGPGGTGKTRLAIEAVSKVAETFQGGIWFVPLADIADAGLIAGEIVDALGIPRSGQVEPIEQAVTALAKQPSLLILDNFEQLVEDGAYIVQTLLQRLPSLQCVVTSRQLLGLPGEQAFAVPPLATPNGADTPERLSLFESVQLFVDRAQASKPDFRISNSNAPDVAELCDRLEGLPLAIELAAARTLVLTPSQMLQQLSRRFEFLVSRRRGVAERQRTQWAAIDWSYRLLSPELQRFFAQLSVFRGGWTVEAAEAVCEEPMVLDYLAQLHECSMVATLDKKSGIRFRMLDTLREYAEEQLSAEERAIVKERHLDFCLTLAEQARRELAGRNQALWYDRLDTESDNLRSAVGLCLAVDRAETGLRLAGALQQFLDVRGYWHEGLSWFIRILDYPGAQRRTALRAHALNGAGILAYAQGDYTYSRALHEESLAIRRELGDRQGVAASLGNQGNVANAQGDLAAARVLFEECLALFREVGDQHGIAGILNNIADIVSDQGDYADARALYEEGLAVARHAGNAQGIARAIYNLGKQDIVQADYISAKARFEESLPMFRALGDKRGVAWVLNGLGLVARKQSDLTSSQSLYEESLAIHRELGYRQGIAASLGNIGNIARDRGDCPAAYILYKESLEISAELGDRRYIVLSLEALGWVAAAQDHQERAIKVWGAMYGLQEQIGVGSCPTDQDKLQSAIAELRGLLGEVVFTAAWDAGHVMTWEQAVVFALERTGE